MIPFEMNFNTALPNLIQTPKIPKFPKVPKFQVLNFVRVPDKRSVYSKAYTTNWNKELFKLHKIKSTNSVTYTLEDENKEIFQGKYYEQELLRSVFNIELNNKTLESMNIFYKFE